MQPERQTFRSLDCLIAVPSRTTEEPRPILVFLHGRDEAGPALGLQPNIQQKLTAHGPLAPTAIASVTEGLIIVAPQLPHPGGNVWPARAATVSLIARDVAEAHGGDVTRMYLTGFSYGGNGVLHLGSEPNAPWAALWAVDPPAVPTGATRSPIWLSAGKYAGPNAAELKRRLQLREVNEVTPGVSVYDYVGPGHGEVARESYRAPRAPRVYKWLLEHRRATPAPPEKA